MVQRPHPIFSPPATTASQSEQYLTQLFEKCICLFIPFLSFIQLTISHTGAFVSVLLTDDGELLTKNSYQPQRLRVAEADFQSNLRPPVTSFVAIQRCLHSCDKMCSLTLTMS